MLTPELLCRPGTEPCKPTYGRDQVLILGLTEQARAEVPPHCGTCLRVQSADEVDKSGGIAWIGSRSSACRRNGRSPVLAGPVRPSRVMN